MSLSNFVANRFEQILKKFLIIQTAFIGDVILATPLIEILHKHDPRLEIDFLLRKGNESLLQGHPKLRQVHVWDKKRSKYFSLWRALKKIRQEKYDVIINCHRFASSGFIAGFSNAKVIIGFDKNPFSFLFHHKISHQIGGNHEVERNVSLLSPIISIPDSIVRPKLYPSTTDFDSIPKGNYICMAPASVWFTKQLPEKKWVELCNSILEQTSIFLLGANSDFKMCERIKKQSHHTNIKIKAGELSLLQSAAWMSRATMNYVNDSAPLHLASSMNAPCTAFFCSTIPDFGFYPLSDDSKMLETKEPLACRPCGLHGRKECPKGHFKCGDIDLSS